MSSIEWTDETWNPAVGCARRSPGCENCYAERLAARLVRMEAGRGRQSVYLPVVDAERGRWNRKGAQVPDRLDWPLGKRKPLRIFVCSMSDLFFEEHPFEFIAAVFGVMAATPRHTFQVLTKRPRRMLEFFAWLGDRRAALKQCFLRASTHIPDDGAWKRWRDQGRHAYDGDFPWPLTNVHLGVSIEDQQRADERIPVLLECPAAVRFLSCEPLLERVDLSTWIRPLAPVSEANAPREWGDFPWPDFVPERVRSQVAEFWSEFGRVPANYARDCHEQNSPPIGANLKQGDKAGRWVHCWNNMGRLVDDDGVDRVASIPRSGLFDVRRHDWHGIGWVIVGGESGPGARECEVASLRSIVSQCRAADVPCFVKQLGARPVHSDNILAPGVTYAIDLKDRKGADPSEWPEDLRVQEMPRAVTHVRREK